MRPIESSFKKFLEPTFQVGIDLYVRMGGCARYNIARTLRDETHRMPGYHVMSRRLVWSWKMHFRWALNVKSSPARTLCRKCWNWMIWNVNNNPYCITRRLWIRTPSRLRFIFLLATSLALPVEQSEGYESTLKPEYPILKNTSNEVSFRNWSGLFISCT